MSVKKLTLTSDHLAIIRNIKFEKFDFNEDEKIKHHYAWGIDEYNLFGGSSYIMESIAVILGKYDTYIKGTEENPMGREFPKELEDYWWSLYQYIWDNMEYVISLVLYMTTEGGIVPGIYEKDEDDVKWKLVKKIEE